MFVQQIFRLTTKKTPKRLRNEPIVSLWHKNENYELRIDTYEYRP